MLNIYFGTNKSWHIGVGKKSGKPKISHSFGGINVIFCGNFHQFTPVAWTASNTLYHPSNMAMDSMDLQLGCAIYKEFNTIVILKEQLRVTDSVWHWRVPDSIWRLGCVEWQATTWWELTTNMQNGYINGTRTPDTSMGSLALLSYYVRCSPPS